MLSDENIQNSKLFRANSQKTATHSLKNSAIWNRSDHSLVQNSNVAISNKMIRSAMKSAGSSKTRKSVLIMRPESLKRANTDACMAAAIGDLEWLKQSLKVSSEMAFDKNGFATIHLASIHGRINIIKYLVEEMFVDPNTPSTHGWRPIHLCINNQIGQRAIDCLKYFIQHGALINVFNEDGLYPIHMAASEGHASCAKILLENKADPMVLDSRGQKPIDLAKLWGHKECAKVLLAAMWHSEKNLQSKMRKLSERLRTQDILLEIEREHSVLQTEINLGLGDKQTEHKIFDNWLTNQKFINKNQVADQSIVPHRESITAKKKLPSIKKAHDDETSDEEEPKRTVHAGKIDKRKGIPVRNKYIPLEHDNEWNYSTKVSEKEYMRNLDDFYPRDPYTCMPNDIDILLLYRHLNGMTLEQVKEFMQNNEKDKADIIKLAKLDQEYRKNKKQTSKSNSKERPVYYRPMNIIDYESKKMQSPEDKHLDEVGLNLTNDKNSFYFKDSKKFIENKSSTYSKHQPDDVLEIKNMIEFYFNSDLYDYMKDKNGKIHPKYEKVFIY